MNCLKCGATLEADSKFCVSCGANVETKEDVENGTASNVSPIEEIKEKVISANPNNLVKKIGLVVGTLLIIIGLTRIIGSGTGIYSTSFGADFYTYAYRGIVEISEILASIEATLGWVVVSIGAAIDVISLKR